MDKILQHLNKSTMPSSGCHAQHPSKPRQGRSDNINIILFIANVLKIKFDFSSHSRYKLNRA